jgi:predicted esterase
MSRANLSVPGLLGGLFLCAAGYGLLADAASATELVMKDGRIFGGKEARVASLADMPAAPQANGAGPIQMIVLLDDDLRRTFVPKLQIREVRQEDAGQLDEKFKIRQKVLRSGQAVKTVGSPVKITPFDEFGRRIYSFSTVKGPVDVIQGITEITPQWTKVEGISHVWDMRIATSSIPRDVLSKILLKQIDPNDVEQRKRIARFYLQSERYKDARAELEAIVKAFADKTDVRAALEPLIQSIRQLEAKQLLGELKVRRAAGQHQMVQEMLKVFPSEDVAGEILQAVREMVEEYKTLEARRAEVLQQFDALLAAIKDTALRSRIEPIRREIAAELDISTLGRLAAFRQTVDDKDTPPAEKLSLAISGWLLGTDAAIVQLSASLSVHKVRELVRQYLSEPQKINREQVLGNLSSEQSATPALVAALLANMKPAVALPSPVDPKMPGLYRLQIVGLPKEPPTTYLVQVPPEYNPYRRYPAIVTLSGAGSTAQQQVDWWAGGWTKGGWRSGQATRYGYIVIAPEWTTAHQKQYNYSAREHAAVLSCLRDASQRLAIDTDRVFLSGHDIGGDAAWDIGLAHPDLWAGVIPLVGRADRFCAFYWENAERVPFYVVCGELDAAQLTKNSRDLDRYLKRGYNATVVEYLGRGHEHFSDEILRLFDWMGRFRRNLFPREFTGVTMRPGDNSFWWVELGGLPAKAIVDPADWPLPRGTQAVRVTGKITDNNGLYVTTGTSQLSVRISPEMLNLKQRVNITANGRRVNSNDRFVELDLRTMLEDVRTRGDRQHPCWAKLDVPTGRTAAAP